MVASTVADIEPKRLSDEELKRIIARCEARLLAGTSRHADMVLLVQAELELVHRLERKEAQRLKEEARISASQTRAGDKATLII